MSPILIDSSWRQSKNRRWWCGSARAKNTDRKSRHPVFQSSDQPGLPTCVTKAEVALSLFAGGRNPGPLGTWGILRARNLTWAAKMGFRGLFQKPWQSFQNVNLAALFWRNQFREFRSTKSTTVLATSHMWLLRYSWSKLRCPVSNALQFEDLGWKEKIGYFTNSSIFIPYWNESILDMLS